MIGRTLFVVVVVGGAAVLATIGGPAGAVLGTLCALGVLLEAG